jgi:hypothetical protein
VVSVRTGSALGVIVVWTGIFVVLHAASSRPAVRNTTAARGRGRTGPDIVHPSGHLLGEPAVGPQAQHGVVADDRAGDIAAGHQFAVQV